MVFSNSYSAIANTTTEQIYDVMPLAFPSYENFYFQSGFYHPSTDSFDFSVETLYPDTGGSVYSQYIDSSYDKFDDYPALKFTVRPESSWTSGLGYSVNSSFRYLFSTASFYQIYGSFVKYQYLTASAQPFNAFATVTYSYNYQIYDEDTQSWYQRSGTQTEDVPLSVSLSPISLSETEFNFIWDLSFQSGEPTFDKGDQVRNVSSRVSALSMTIVYPAFGSMYYGTGLTDGDLASSIFYVTSAKLDSFYQSGGTSSSGNNNSVGNAISSVSRQVSNLSNKLTTVQTSVESKIDTMGSNIVTGLNNVVQSAQQNTQNIINTVTQKVDEVKTGITEVKDSIIDLPNKLEEMLTGFFVPDEETINAKFAEFETLLSDRFGLIYQSADIIHDFADSFQSQAVMLADTGGVIQLPSVTVNLAGTDFSFGGYDVDIIPDGFEFLQTAVRLATSMICTVVFINMCKNKLEAILK